MACLSPIVEAERDFWQRLKRVRAVDATFKQLTRDGEDDQVLTTLRRRDRD